MRTVSLITKTLFIALIAVIVACITKTNSQQNNNKLTRYVNPLLGTATLWKPEDLGYVRKMKQRTWGAEVFPGSSVPNAMVQLSPVTQFRNGAGYQYEDSVIYGFSHTCKGHWNLLHVPMLPVIGKVTAMDYRSTFSHDNESARPGYYQVYLNRFKVNAELTSTLRCAFHKYTFQENDEKALLVNVKRSNNRVGEWDIQKVDEHTFTGMQSGEGKIYYYAVSNYPIDEIEQVKEDERNEVAIVHFSDSKDSMPLELKIGFSFVSVENAKMNLAIEMQDKSFSQVQSEADSTWEELLGKMFILIRK